MPMMSASSGLVLGLETLPFTHLVRYYMFDNEFTSTELTATCYARENW